MNEMKSNEKSTQVNPVYPLNGEYAGGIANLLKVIVKVMEDQGSSSEDITRQVRLTCRQFGVALIHDFEKCESNDRKDK